MGAAAYQRGNQRIAKNIDEEQRDPSFQMMDDLNALPKNDGAPRPFGPIHFVFSHGGWFAECPVTGYGYYFKTLRAAVRSFRVSINEYRNGVWIGIPE